MASYAYFDTKRKIKRQTGNWVHFAFGWVQNAQSKTEENTIKGNYA